MESIENVVYIGFTNQSRTIKIGGSFLSIILLSMNVLMKENWSQVPNIAMGNIPIVICKRPFSRMN